ncbi:MAG: ABC transporter ATP-binding protein [bacterium]
MANVRLRNITKRFGDLEAVKNLNLQVKDRSFVVLLGPSGCGKTTTLRCVAGLESPEEGEIYFDDELVNDLSPADRNVAFVFQFYALYPHLTVWENVAFPLRAERLPKAELNQRVEKILKLLRIESLRDHKSRRLTSGQAQRVALGRAIIRRPKVFLLDEPLSNLEAKFREQMRSELKRLQTSIGATTLYVTHDQTEAMSMADKIAVMDLGVVQQIGSPREIYSHPANLFVANFIGSPGMNFLECRLNEGGRVTLKENSGSFNLELPKDSLAMVREKASSKDLIVGIRPEDISFCNKSDPHALKAEVYVFEPLGSENIINLKIGETIIKARTPPSLVLRAEEEVWMRFKEKKIHIFDKNTEKNLL